MFCGSDCNNKLTVMILSKKDFVKECTGFKKKKKTCFQETSLTIKQKIIQQGAKLPFSLNKDRSKQSTLQRSNKRQFLYIVLEHALSNETCLIKCCFFSYL